MFLYHITPQTDWQKALSDGCYTADSLEREGFIHCSTRAQVIATADRFYHGQAGLLLLVIDPQRLGAEVKYETPPGTSEAFPHIYGPLNLEAVVKALDFPPRADGSFTFPDD
jgi:uncharacterized protein (DUF952 family)